MRHAITLMMAASSIDVSVTMSRKIIAV